MTINKVQCSCGQPIEVEGEVGQLFDCPTCNCILQVTPPLPKKKSYESYKLCKYCIYCDKVIAVQGTYHYDRVMDNPVCFDCQYTAQVRDIINSWTRLYAQRMSQERIEIGQILNDFGFN